MAFASSWDCVQSITGPGSSNASEVGVGVQSSDGAQSQRVVIIGLGGTGGEILRCLTNVPDLSIEIVDFDTVSATNLNRQSFFTLEDVGRYKAEVVAERVTESTICGGASVHARCVDATTLPPAYYAAFAAVVVAVDSHSVRRCVVKNAMRGCALRAATITRLSSAVDPSPSPLLSQSFQRLPVIDCGSSGLHGHIFTFVRGVTACVECASVAPLYEDGHPEHRPAVEACVAASRPRTIEHLASHAVVEWEATRGGVTFDVEDGGHLKEVMERARVHAIKFGLRPPLDSELREVLDTAVPSSASALSVVGSVVALEVLRVLKGWTPSCGHLGQWVNVSLARGGHTSRVDLGREPDCLECASLSAYREM